MRNQADQHASGETLERYSLGDLPEAETERLEEHLLICPHCQVRLADEDAFVRATREAAADLLESRLAPARWFGAVLGRAPKLALCAAAILAIWAGVRVVSPMFNPRLPLAVTLEATRGGTAVAPAGPQLRLELDASGLPVGRTYIVRVVSASGAPVLETEGPRSADRIRVAETARFAPGRYWVRVYDRSRKLLREYGLMVSKDATR